jgi:hypothetical protein
MTRWLSVPFNGSAVTVLNAVPKLRLPVAEPGVGPYRDTHWHDLAVRERDVDPAEITPARRAGRCLRPAWPASSASARWSRHRPALEKVVLLRVAG